MGSYRAGRYRNFIRPLHLFDDVERFQRNHFRSLDASSCRRAKPDLILSGIDIWEYFRASFWERLQQNHRAGNHVDAYDGPAKPEHGT